MYIGYINVRMLDSINVWFNRLGMVYSSTIENLKLCVGICATYVLRSKGNKCQPFVVIPKEGLAGGAPPQSFFGTPTL